MASQVDDLSGVYDNFPGVLYHYTDAEGLLGIVRSRQLWFSHPAFMNDPSERLYVRELVGEVADEHGFSTAAVESAINLQLETGTSRCRYLKVRTSCRCGESTGPLGEGFCIGIDFAPLADAWRVLQGAEGTYINKRPVFGRVDYDRDSQRNAIARVLDGAHDDAWRLQLMKHPTYVHEQEWRAFLFFRHTPVYSKPEEYIPIGADVLKYRARGDGALVPYGEVPLDGLQRGFGPKAPTPLVSVMLRPKLHEPKYKAGLQMLLEGSFWSPDESTRVPEIRRSDIWMA